MYIYLCKEMGKARAQVGVCDLLSFSRITWLIALLYLPVTNSYAYFSGSKVSDCL